MRPGLAAGSTRTNRYAIGSDRTIPLMDEGLRVYATSSLVWDMEETCQQLLGEYLTDAENSLGERVEIDHIGPTPEGMWVDVVATVTDVVGRRVTFAAEIRDELDVVGRAKHVRFVVDLARQRERLEARAAKLGQLKKG